MNEPFIHLVAHWSAWFVSPLGKVKITSGLRQKLIERLETLPSRLHGVVELREQAKMLDENELIGPDHPFNQLMLRFVIEREREIPQEYRTNVENIKSFFSEK